MRKIKIENIVFIALIIAYIYNAINKKMDTNINLLLTLGVQFTLSYLVRLAIQYIRKNPKVIINEIKEILKDK